MSNWTGSLTEQFIQDKTEAGVRFCIIGTYDVEQARMQVSQALSVGWEVGLYVYLYFDGKDMQRLNQALVLAKAVPGCRVWLDVEEQDSGKSPVEVISQMFDLVWRCEKTGTAWGIYTSRNMWTQITDDSDLFNDAPLWDAAYDGVPTFDYFVSYGGWTVPTIKQYKEGGEDWNVRLKL